MKYENTHSPVFIVEFGYFVCLQDNVFFQFIRWDWILKKLSLKPRCLVDNLKMRENVSTDSVSEKRSLSHACACEFA